MLRQVYKFVPVPYSSFRNFFFYIFQFMQIPLCLIGFICMYLGLGTEFRSEKIPRNRPGMVSVIPRKKALIPRHSEFRGRANSEALNGTERNGIPRKKIVLRNRTSLRTCIEVGGGSCVPTNVVKYILKLGKVLRNSSKITSELCSLPRNGSERNFENLHLFWFHGTEFRVVFSSAEGFGTE